MLILRVIIYEEILRVKLKSHVVRTIGSSVKNEKVPLHPKSPLATTLWHC